MPETLEIKIPTPGPNEVRIEVKAIGINRAESMWRRDGGMSPEKSAGPGYEAAGFVAAVGSAVRGLSVGEAVNIIPTYRIDRDKTFGAIVIVPDYAVEPHRKALTFAESAAAWMMFVAAYDALIGEAKLARGDHVVISAASSSIGLAALQIANYAGAITVALDQDAERRQRLLEIGARHIIATDGDDLAQEIMRITAGKGARVVIDPVGGPTFSKLVTSLAPGGVAILYGASSPDATLVPVLDAIAKGVTIKAHNIWLASGDAVATRAAVEFVLAGIEAGALTPVIDHAFPFDQMIDVHRYL